MVDLRNALARLRRPGLRTVVVVLLALSVGCANEENVENPRPNILLIVGDDMGYSDIGAFGSEIRTPNLDALAESGVLLTQFHVAPNCGPTRGAMLSGVDYHLAGMGGNPEVAADNQRGQPSYVGYLSDRVVTLAEVLREAGYHTYMTGKWHLGRGEGRFPTARGFEQAFALMNGAASHYADQNPIVPGSATMYVENGEPVSELPSDFYSSTAYTDRMIGFIGDNLKDGKPFFAYLSYTAAHNPLHAPTESIEKYSGRYDKGWDELARERVARLRELGLLDESDVAHPRPNWVHPWEALTGEQQAARARDMEVYAGMIDYLDESIGRVLEYLREVGAYDNTLIVFLSDNGPSRTTVLDYVTLGGETAEFFGQFDNSLENKGLPNSSIDIGPGWAHAAASPFRLFKGYVTQGGVQVPAIVKPPSSMPAAVDRVAAPTHVTDLMPTFLDVSGGRYPEMHNGNPIPPMQGLSLMPLLEGEQKPAFLQRGIGWSAYGMDAYRRGDWKAVRLPEPFGNGTWQLYNLAEDPGEVHDLASEQPETVAELGQAWEEYAETNGVIPPNKPIAYSKPISGKKY